jgi:hypothetical protein
MQTKAHKLAESKKPAAVSRYGLYHFINFYSKSGYCPSFPSTQPEGPIKKAMVIISNQSLVIT